MKKADKICLRNNASKAFETFNKYSVTEIDRFILELVKPYMKKVIIRKVVLSGIALGVIFLVSSEPAQAQSAKNTISGQKDIPVSESVQPAALGTYQILAKDANSHEIFPIDILLEIEKNRDQKKVVFMKAGESSIIKILPYREINGKNFVPVPEYGVQE